MFLWCVFQHTDIKSGSLIWHTKCYSIWLLNICALRIKTNLSYMIWTLENKHPIQTLKVSISLLDKYTETVSQWSSHLTVSKSKKMLNWVKKRATVTQCFPSKAGSGHLILKTSWSKASKPGGPGCSFSNTSSSLLLFLY